MVLVDLRRDRSWVSARERRHALRVTVRLRTISIVGSRGSAGAGARAVVRKRGLRLRRGRHECVHVLLMHGAIERVGGRHGADQDQHDEPHAFLAVIPAVKEAHAGAGQDQQAANPQAAAAYCPRVPCRAPGCWMVALRMVNSNNAALKPINGDNNRVSPILVAWAQSTPLVPEGLAAMS